ncbi:class I SAM-dependent methyltransferase [Natronorarus salvus]|uniref:class I SAM-dependent methyltransferase n=1 Tax=Natronorarus salvus TaxID=3117733 RepID=UPI002F26239E
MRDSERKRATADSFDRAASEYVGVRVHRTGEDVERIAEWCAGADRALDVATGAGHTARALADEAVRRVVAADAAPAMAATADGLRGVEGVVADAERLPFATGFDAVTCRIAAHHFPEPERFVSEAARVLRPGGLLILEDNVVPSETVLDGFLNGVERLRDPTHVRSYTVPEWRSMLAEGGFEIEESIEVWKPLVYGDWVERIGTPRERRERLAERFADPPAGAVEAFSIEYGAGGVERFANPKRLFRASLSG